MTSLSWTYAKRVPIFGMMHKESFKVVISLWTKSKIIPFVKRSCLTPVAATTTRFGLVSFVITTTASPKNQDTRGTGETEKAQGRPRWRQRESLGYVARQPGQGAGQVPEVSQVKGTPCC